MISVGRRQPHWRTAPSFTQSHRPIPHQRRRRSSGSRWLARSVSVCLTRPLGMEAEAPGRARVVIVVWRDFVDQVTRCLGLAGPTDWASTLGVGLNGWCCPDAPLPRLLGRRRSRPRGGGESVKASRPRIGVPAPRCNSFRFGESARPATRRPRPGSPAQAGSWVEPPERAWRVRWLRDAMNAVARWRRRGRRRGSRAAATP